MEAIHVNHVSNTVSAVEKHTVIATGIEIAGPPGPNDSIG
jgi:hypothetical protein